ncbi:hypothetical protein KIN20_014442 [Parelaphostrongylus tenuis]|uniref:Uncharacterized protein n=1 Tax=Parelaphostrongylus tenuis TaxID=148309 RepID=A0AAD5MDN1_PARTN|nr:hypothetical protein KIN20_014442 [Parelaphostrongylus tenuis]
MSDGLSYLGSFIRRYQDMEHFWTEPFAAFSGDCPVYRTYKSKDGKWMAVGALEPKFSISLFRILGMDKTEADIFTDPEGLSAEMEKIFETKTQAEWVECFDGQNACVTPVLELDEAVRFKHNVERNSFTKEGDQYFPEPAPRMYSVEEYEELKSSL